MLSPDARRLLKKLAKFENRSRSNLLEVLIFKEGDRVLKTENKPA